MNPGTIMFIVLGVIGLLIYISKSLKPSSLENFSVIDESQISNKGQEGFDKLKDGNLNFETLLGAFTTPAVNLDGPTRFGSGPLPSVADYARLNKTQTVNLPSPNPVSPPMVSTASIQSQTLSPVPPTVTPVLINKTPALPPMVPASIINMPTQPVMQIQPTVETNVAAQPMTISDLQGSSLKKSAEPFEEQRKKQNDIRNDKKRKQRKTKTKIVYVDNECPKLPDMSQYIRKDSIPCWGCNLK